MAVGAHAREFRMSMGWPAYRPDDVERGLQLARAGLAIAGDDPAVVSRCSLVLLQLGAEFDLAVATMRRAVENNPNDPATLAWAGFANMISGHIEDAASYYGRALKLSPNSGIACDVLTGLAHLHICKGEYEAALAAAHRAIAVNPSFLPPHWMVIAANGQLGRLADARREIERLEAMAPATTIARMMQTAGAQSSPSHRALMAGLRLAGLPER